MQYPDFIKKAYGSWQQHSGPWGHTQFSVRRCQVPDGDKLEDLEEANLFSFKEFLKTKNLSLSKEDTNNSRVYQKEALRHPWGLDRNSPASQPMGYGLEYQQPFFQDPTRASNLEEDEEEDGWNGAYLPSAVEQTHCSRATENSSPCGTYLSFFFQCIRAGRTWVFVPMDTEWHQFKDLSSISSWES